ncbi:hypothetical protein BH23THE1_BH23THE1_20470 [soil metagenome]
MVYIVLGLVLLGVLVLSSWGPNLAQAFFHDHVENLGDSITDL